MHVISKGPFRDCWAKHPDSEKPLRALLTMLEGSKAQNFNELKKAFPSADYVPSKYTVFDVAGNEYRVVATVQYGNQQVYVQLVGTHKDYDIWTKKNRKKK
jgi:mRNA interferase HigB